MPRTLTEDEFNAIKQKVLDSLPSGLSEADFTRAVAPRMAAALGEAENSPEAVQGSALGRFVGGAWQNLNPLEAAKGVYSAVAHPLDTAGNILAQQGQQFQQAYDLAKEGRGTEAAGHAVAGMIPILGPAAARAGETIASGDIAGGLGQGAGLIAPFAASEALALRNRPNPGKADLLKREATQQVAQQVLAPGNPAYRGKAQAIAPDVLARNLSGSRIELQQLAQEGMADAGTRIDQAIGESGGMQARVPAGPIAVTLERRIHDLQDSNGVPLSEAAARRISALSDRITQLKALERTKQGLTREDLMKIRDENYRIADDARAYERMGNPMQSDEGWAARETGSAAREHLAGQAPGSAAANADYAFFKTLNDVLDPVIGRPKDTKAPSGVTGGSRMVGAAVGHLTGSPMATFVLSTVKPWIEDVYRKPAWQLASAQSKMRLAEAIERGHVPAAKSILLNIFKYQPRTDADAQ